MVEHAIYIYAYSSLYRDAAMLHPRYYLPQNIPSEIDWEPDVAYIQHLPHPAENNALLAQAGFDNPYPWREHSSGALLLPLAVLHTRHQLTMQSAAVLTPHGTARTLRGLPVRGTLAALHNIFDADEIFISSSLRVCGELCRTLPKWGCVIFSPSFVSLTATAERLRGLYPDTPLLVHPGRGPRVTASAQRAADATPRCTVSSTWG
jgi:hypothetical protein